MKPPKPTSDLPQTPFLYKDFQLAAAALRGALTAHHSYMLLLGDSGCGKTTLLRHLQQHLDKHSYSVLYLCHGRPSPSGLARVLADAVHLPIRRSRAETSRLLVSTLKNLPTRLLFWIDEAQLIHDDTLHELRLLSEADLEGPPLFSVILCALPALKERLLAPDLFPLWRRIGTRVRLRGLQHEEVMPFVSHCLGKNSAQRFSHEALSLIFEKARGIPAIVKSYCANCLHEIPPTTEITKQLADELLDLLD
jgi:type II secretory pathway predicted ATPase ExeA